MMETNFTKMLLVSANVGSIFEDPEKMLKMWLKEFLETVKRLEPGFLAIHCQEVGGKNYEVSMQHVNSFIKSLLASEELEEFDCARLFLDEDFTAVDQFTALGNLYFIHRSLKNVQVYDFKECKFVAVEGREVLSGNIESVSIKEKAKFPQEFFPDFKWSRKGFIRTRWNIHNSIFDLVNIHLFHDASNIVAMESSPSQYSCNRKRTLQHTLDRLENDKHENVPIFLFGDFNFRLDTCKLIQNLTQKSIEHKTHGKKNDISQFTYKHDTDDEVVLTVGKKGFDHHQHSQVFSESNGQWLQQFDKEADIFRERLQELDITFPPSYPFSEDVDDGTSYSKTRCPGWCDRIMFTPTARMLMNTDEGLPEYKMMGTETCMGDHKPIFMNVKLRHNTGNMTDSASDSPISQHQPLKKVISINGEEVQVSSLDDINIHDYASFEQEEHLTRKFMSTIRRKQGIEKKASFRNVVQDVMRVERTMKALRHYSHRSDTETEDTEDEGGKSAASEDERSLSGEKLDSQKQDINANVGDKSKVTNLSAGDGMNVNMQDNSNAPNNNNHVSISDQLKPQLMLDAATDKPNDPSVPNDLDNNNRPAAKEIASTDDVKVAGITTPNRDSRQEMEPETGLKEQSPNKRPGKCNCCVVM